jgi:hypothetical protein
LAAAALLATLSAVRPLPAQIDYRNLEDGRPVFTEDAYPIDQYAFELALPYRFEREPGGTRTHVFDPEISYGIIPNGEAGVRTALAVLTAGGATDWGLGGLTVFALYNVNTELAWLPALSLRGDLSLPVGALAGDAVRYTLKGIATRSFGRVRVHVNALVSLGADQPFGAVGPPPRWAFSAAGDLTLLRAGLLLIADAVTLRPPRDEPVQLNAEVGARYQWTPTLVASLGVSRRVVEDVGPDFGLTIGLSYAFALRGLMPRAAR